MILPPVAKHRRDWFWVIRRLMAHGVSMGDIGRACDRQTTTVQGWAEGGEPKESDARIVLALLAKVAPEEYAAHQAEFDIRMTIKRVSRPGDQTRLEFVDLG